MSINDELVKSILSMDAYNRGYNPSIEIEGSNIGNFSLSTDSLILGTVDGTLERLDQSLGFYAAAYQYGDETIISYRGTDDPGGLISGGDVFYGWLASLGYLNNNQLGLAIQFYTDVAETIGGDFVDYQTVNISTTGHSLGGGLASYIGALYGRDAYGFDAMPFTIALEETIEQTTKYDVVWIDASNVTHEEKLDYSTLLAYESNPDIDVQSSQIINPFLKELIYGTPNPLIEGGTWAPSVIDNIFGSYMAGEVLALPRSLVSPPYPEFNTENSFYREAYLGNYGEYLVDDNGELIFGAIDNHSMSSLIISMFATPENIGSSEDWKNAAPYFWPALYNGQFAKDIGMDDPRVSGQLQTDANDGATAKYSDILRQIIAYSAIDEGADSTAARPFGDTAIRALYNDANDLGAALISAGEDSVVETFATDISRVFVHFSGQLALNKILQNDVPGALAVNGILDYSDPTNNLALSVNLSEDYWTLLTDTTDHNADSSRDSLVTNIAIASNVDSIFATTSELWGDAGYTAFDRVAFASTDYGESIIADATVPTDKATLFIGSIGDDILTGSSANDLIIGGIIGGVAGTIEGHEALKGNADGDDTLNGGAGDDILIGGFGDDVLSGGLGTNILNGYGGITIADIFYGTETTGIDTADYSWFSEGVTVSVDHDGNGAATGIGISDTMLSIDNIIGSAGVDIISTNVVWAEIAGGEGDDVLSGARRYHYNSGDGNDTIIANDGHTSISLLDYSSGSMSFTVNGSDYVIGLSDGAQITIQDFFDGGYDNVLGVSASNTNIGITEWYGEGDENENNLDGPVRYFSEWRQSNGDLHGFSVDDPATPEIDESKDSIYAPSSYIITGFDEFDNEIHDIIYDFDVSGFGGNDNLQVLSDGDNEILGGEGNDTIESHNGGNDFIDGGTGNDSIKIYSSVVTTVLGGEGHDHIESHDGGDDVIDGGEGKDFIKIYSSDSTTVYGGGGGDSINTYDGGNDVIYGGAGHDDISTSGVGNSIIYGGDGNDILSVHHVGANYVDGGEGNDEIRAYSFDSSVVYSNELYGRNGDDDIRGSSGTDTIYGGEGNDVLFTSSLNAENTGTDILDGGSDDDILLANGAVNNMYGGTGNDIFIQYGNNLTSSDIRMTNIYDTNGQNLLVFSVDSEVHRPQDLLFQSSGISDLQITFRGTNQVVLVDDYYNNLNDFQHLAFSYDDTISEASSVSATYIGAQSWFDELYLLNDFIQADQDNILGTDNIDTIAGTILNDRIFALEGNDTVHGFAGDDFLLGDDGDDYIDGGEGNDLLRGGQGLDIILGGEGNDEITGNEGDDILSGNDGADIIRGGTGIDTIEGGSGNDELYGGNGEDELSGGEDDDVIVGNGDNDILNGDSGDDEIYGGTVFTEFYDPFANGSIYDGSNELYGGSGNDNLYGGVEDDILDGGFGDDKLYGGGGSDSLVFTYGQSDVLGDYYDGGNEFSFMGSGGTDTLVLMLSTGEASDAILAAEILEYEADILTYSHENYFHFTSLNLYATGFQVLEIQTTYNTINGTSGDDVITGTISPDEVFAGAGNDIVEGKDGDDVIYGEDGNDTLFGSAGADQLFGGEGNDEILGFEGAELINGGAGEDLVYYTYGLNTEGVHIDLEQGVGLAGAALGDQYVSIENAAGTAYNDIIIGDSNNNVLIGADGNDTINGGGGNDNINGGGGADILTGGSGDDTFIVNFHASNIVTEITDFNASEDKLNFGLFTTDVIPATDVIITEVGADLLLTINGENNHILRNVEPDQLTNANFLTPLTNSAINQVIIVPTTINTITGTTGDDIPLNGTADADEVFGLAGNDTIVGKAGDDILHGDAGNDILKGEADNDTLYGGIGDDDLRGHGGNDILYGEEDNDLLGGYDGDDELHGGSGDDEANGGSGIDLIYGGSGDDTLRGNEDADVIYGGDGDDEIYGDTTYDDGWGAADEIHGGAGNDTAWGSRGNDMLYGDGGIDTLYGGYGDDEIHGGTENDILRGDRGADVIYGDDGDDIINGNRGNDYLYGGAGNDTIEGGEGHDHIYGGDGNDTLKGDTDNDFLYGEAGNDILRGHDDQDVLYGGADNDTIDGYLGNDRIFGGGGADTLYGNRHNGTIPEGESDWDQFYFDATSFDGTFDTIKDFSVPLYEKIIVIDDVLTGYDAATSVIADFIDIAISGNDTIVSVDRDGTAGTYGFEQIALVEGVTNLGYSNNIRVESDPFI